MTHFKTDFILAMSNCDPYGSEFPTQIFTIGPHKVYWLCAKLFLNFAQKCGGYEHLNFWPKIEVFIYLNWKKYTIFVRNDWNLYRWHKSPRSSCQMYKWGLGSMNWPPNSLSYVQIRPHQKLICQGLFSSFFQPRGVSKANQCCQKKYSAWSQKLGQKVRKCNSGGKWQL